MRLDLEEYNFEIEYIKGKDNCGADAFSRIDFDQVKQISPESIQMYQVTTRSKTKNNSVPQTNIESNTNETQELLQRVYEAISNVGLKKLPCLKYNENERALNILKGKTKMLTMDISGLFHTQIFVSKFLSL